jgi:hypothetical protein
MRVAAFEPAVIHLTLFHRLGNCVDKRKDQAPAKQRMATWQKFDQLSFAITCVRRVVMQEIRRAVSNENYKSLWSCTTWWLKTVENFH